MERMSAGFAGLKQMARDQMADSGMGSNLSTSLASNKGVPATHRGATICGYLLRKKQSRSTLQAAYVKRWYALQGRLLLCFEDEASTEPKKDRTINLEDVVEIHETDKSVTKFDFILRTQSGDGTELEHKLKAETLVGMRRWTEALEKAWQNPEPEGDGRLKENLSPTSKRREGREARGAAPPPRAMRCSFEGPFTWGCPRCDPP